MAANSPTPVAWCLSFTSTSLFRPSPALPNPSPRRVQPKFFCSSPNPSPSSFSDTTHIANATSTNTNTGNTPTDAHPPIAPFQPGLLTDSVLEAKWKNEQKRQEQERQEQEQHTEQPPSPPPVCLYDTPTSHSPTDNIIASDPYKAFATFTRIAAPTASLGRDAASPSDRSLHSVSTAQPSAQLQTALHSPYSTASIAHRLLRYTYANQNLDDFVQFFCGDFDNYDQVAAERRTGMMPRDGGGHEHIHCSIVSLTPRMLFARYYFNGDPSRVFRSRVYQVSVPDSSDGRVVEMRICRFYEETERRLKTCNYDLGAIEWDNDDVYDWLKGCEVYWERYQPRAGERDEASEQLGIESGTRFVGYMKGGGCELYSRELGGRIRVMDDLLLTAKDLWVADRGFDEHDNFVYGNRRGVPYKMKRVKNDGELAWTLSEKAQPPEGYVP